MYACICICWCKCMCIGKRIRVRVYIYTHIHIHVRVCAFVRTQEYKVLHIYIYIHTHTCTNFDRVCYDVLHAPPLSGSRVQERISVGAVKMSVLHLCGFTQTARLASSCTVSASVARSGSHPNCMRRGYSIDYIRARLALCCRSSPTVAWP